MFEMFEFCDRVNKEEATRRVNRLIGIAGDVNGLTRAQLAQRLGRDKPHVTSGYPHIDRLRALAALLKWPLEEVVNYVYQPILNEPIASDWNNKTYDELKEELTRLFNEGEFKRRVLLCEKMASIAPTRGDKAEVRHEQARSFYSMCYCDSAKEACRLAAELCEKERLAEKIELLRGQILFANDDLLLALLVGRALVAKHADHGTREEGFANYLVGQVIRRQMLLRDTADATLCDEAVRAFKTAEGVFLNLAPGEASLEAAANTCELGQLEVLARKDPSTAEQALAALDRQIDEIDARLESDTRGPWMISLAWAAIFSLNIATRTLGGRKHDRYLARLEFAADQLDHWVFRERLARVRFTELRRASTKLHLDEDNQSLIINLIARFPAFRNFGFRLLDDGQLVRTK